jgi:hypothetical protein
MQTIHGSEPPRGGGGRGRGLSFRLWQWCRQGLGRVRTCVNVMTLRSFRTRKAQRHARAHLTLEELMPDLEVPQSMMRVLPTEPLQLPNPYPAVALVLVTTASIVVSITAWWMLALPSTLPGRLLMTGARESASAQFADGTRVDLGADAAVRVNITGQQRSARAITGAFVFTVPDLPTDFWLDMPGAQARISEAAKFQVVVSAVSLDVDVYEGTVLLYEHGVSPEAPARRLQQGQSYHMPVNARAALVAVPAGGVNEPSIADAHAFSARCERPSVWESRSMKGAAPMRFQGLRRLRTGPNAITHRAL